MELFVLMEFCTCSQLFCLHQTNPQLNYIVQVFLQIYACSQEPGDIQIPSALGDYPKVLRAQELSQDTLGIYSLRTCLIRISDYI